jgi:hypothetical protein
MSIVERIRRLTFEQRTALSALEAEEARAIALEELEDERIAAEESYLRRRDNLLGREVLAAYPEIEGARGELARRARERQARFERRRMAVLAAAGEDHRAPAQLDLLAPL